jgi:hypothetical protein
MALLPREKTPELMLLAMPVSSARVLRWGCSSAS